MVEHELKCWPTYFEAIDRGEKNFEVRLDDRGFQKGDVVILKKWDPKTAWYVDYQELRRTISYVLTGGRMGIEPGYVVLALTEELPQ